MPVVFVPLNGIGREYINVAFNLKMDKFSLLIMNAT